MSKDEPDLEPELAGDDAAQDDFSAPFEARSFGGEFVWAQGTRYTSKILRVRAGENVLISTRGRMDMIVMLTGGRAQLEVIELSGGDTDRVELMPATPFEISPEREHRLVAITEVELFTVYSPLESE